MNEQQLLCQLEQLNSKMGRSVEGLAALAHMVDVCDEQNAPMPLQLADLLRMVVDFTANAVNRIDETLAELRATRGISPP